MAHRFVWILALPLIGAAQDRQAPKRIEDARVGRKVDDFDYRDLEGRRGSLGELLRGSKGVVVAMTSVDCPVSKLYRPKLDRMESQFDAKNVRMLRVYPNPAEKPEVSPAVQDMRIAEVLGATRTTDVFLIDAEGILRYRGAIDDQYGIGYRRDAAREHYLLDAVEAMLAGRKITIAATEAPGCPLERDEAKKTTEITYHRDVEPILQRNCQECHRPGEVGPFPFLTYEQVRSKGNAIREAVADRRMPPWFADPAHGSWANDRRLTTREIQTVTKWIDGGMPEGSAKDAPPARTFTDGWKIGTPDLVVSMPKPRKIKAEGTLPYMYSVVRTNLTENQWVRAIEVRAGNREVVHHILVFLQRKKKALQDLESTGGGLESYFGIMVPGEEPTVFAEGEVKLIPAGSSLMFQIHYTPNGTATEDQSSVGFLFSKEPPKREVVTKGIYNIDLKIPPGEGNHRDTASYEFEEDVEIRSFLPHMHLRGKSFRYEAIYPDDRREILLDVPKYDFNWQLQYRPKKPLRIPKGTKLVLTGAFDNSETNPANPDPKKTVYFGEQTDEEMLIGYIDYVRAP